MRDQRAEVLWRDDKTPVSTRFDDPYFSLENGLAETRHVFLAGNDLPARFCDGFHIAELGFGTGLNFLSTLAAWDEANVPGTLRYTSFEAYPLDADDMARALDAFPALAPLARRLVQYWRARRSCSLRQDVHFTLIEGDARITLPEWDGAADAWFLDGFSPAKNPELWTVDLMQAVASQTQPNGTFATYTAAGAVRRALETAGFDVKRVPGYGRKRHMSVGNLR